MLSVHFAGTRMKITYDKEPRCYICGRTEKELNFFLLDDRVELEKTIKKAQKARKKHMEKIIASNREIHKKHMEHVKETPVNYEFTMEVILKDFEAFNKIIPDLTELVELYKICNKIHQESKLMDLVKVLKNYYNIDQLAEDDKEIRKLEYELKVLDGISLKFQSVSTKLEYLTDISSFDIKGTKYESYVVSVDICPNCEKLIQKYGN